MGEGEGRPTTHGNGNDGETYARVNPIRHYVSAVFGDDFPPSTTVQDIMV